MGFLNGLLKAASTVSNQMAKNIDKMSDEEIERKIRSGQLKYNSVEEVRDNAAQLQAYSEQIKSNQNKE